MKKFNWNTEKSENEKNKLYAKSRKFEKLKKKEIFGRIGRFKL